MLTFFRNGSNGIAATRWQRLAIILWIILLTGSCVRCLVGRSDRNVGLFSVYGDAGRHWVAGADLYPEKDSWDSFLYSPTIAALMVPYSILPPALGNILWRLSLGSLYFYALYRWSRVVLPMPLSRSQQALIYLLVLPVTAMTLLDGQAGALVAASVLLTITAAAEERWGYAMAWATLGCLLKVYPIALVLLLIATYPRRAILPAAVALVVGLALPFLFQHPGYVADQYVKWFAMMTASDRQGWNLDIANRDVAILFRAWGEPLDRSIWMVTQLGAAAGAAALCIAARRAAWPRQRLLLLLQGLAVCWMVLFGPVVESFTYILIGPTLAWLLVEAWHLRRPWSYRGVLAASWAIFTSATLAVVVMHSIRYHRLGPHPFAGLLLLIGLLADAGKRFTEHNADTVQDPITRQAA